MAESDWSPYEIRFTDGTQQKVQLFGDTLPFSTRKFYRGYLSYDTHALMTGHVEAFEYFDGLAACCKYDGQKAVALRWEGRQPIYNPRFLAFAAHYEFRPLAIAVTPMHAPTWSAVSGRSRNPSSPHVSSEISRKERSKTRKKKST